MCTLTGIPKVGLVAKSGRAGIIEDDNFQTPGHHFDSKQSLATQGRGVWLCCGSSV